MEKDNHKKENNEIESKLSTVKVKTIIDKGAGLIDKSKEGLTSVNNTMSTFSDVTEKANGLIENVKGLGDVYLESKKIDAQTTKDLEKINQAHNTINNHIDKEYDKQMSAMDMASIALEKGLESENIDIISKALDSITNVANHNPMANLQKNIEKEITIEDLDDDDFIIEI